MHIIIRFTVTLYFIFYPKVSDCGQTHQRSSTPVGSHVIRPAGTEACSLSSHLEIVGIFLLTGSHSKIPPPACNSELGLLFTVCSSQKHVLSSCN